MSKRARQMALMGFFQGALSDVMKRREQTRLEEAEARKEARLAAIRKEERDQDFAHRESLTKFELAERRAMAADEIAAREKLTGMEIDARKEISAADNAARLQVSREDNAARIKAQQISASASSGGKPVDKGSIFIDSRTGDTLVNDGSMPDSQFMLAMQKRYGRNLVPYSAGAGSAVVRGGDSPSQGGRPSSAVQPPPVRASAPAGGPRPGDVMDGYRFKGGNPANQASWELI